MFTHSTLDFIDLARIRILVVPVTPLESETFRKYVDLICRLNVISLPDLTPPPLETAKGGKFTEQLFHDGYIYLNFVSSYNKEHLPLEEFQLHRQVLGVIGIMHCQQVNNMTEGLKRFNKILQRYPNALVNRCYAFEPSETQADDTKGVIMIPNVGQLNFYLSTMINDFATDMLVAFGNLAQQYERRPMIPGPHLVSPLLISNTGQSFNQGTSQSDLIAGRNFSSNSISYSNSPITQESSSSLGFNVGGLSFTSSDNKIKKRTPSRAQKLIGDIYLMAGRYDLASASYLAAIEQMRPNGDLQWQGAAAEAYYLATLLSLLGKAGITPQAPLSMIETDQEEIVEEDDDMIPPMQGSAILTPPTTDAIFQAASTNSQLRNFVNELPEKYREIVTLYERGSGIQSTGFVGGGIISVSGNLTYNQQSSNSNQPQLNQPASTFYPLLQIAASLKMAKFLVSMWCARYTGTTVNGSAFPFSPADKGGIAEYASNIVGANPRVVTVDRGSTGTSSSGGTSQVLSLDRTIAINTAGVSRSEISSWVMKAWASGIEYLNVADQIWCVTTMAAVYASIGYKRKHAFYLRQAALLVLSTLKVHKFLEDSTGDLALRHIKITGTNEGSNRKTSGALECLMEACEVLGIKSKASNISRNTPVVSAAMSRRTSSASVALAVTNTGFSGDSDDEDDWMQDLEDDEDIQQALKNPLQFGTVISPTKRNRRAFGSRVKFGWPELQIDLLRHCIEIAEEVDDVPNTIFFASKLLRKLYRNLNEQDQVDISDLLQKLVIRTRSKAGLDKNIHPAVNHHRGSLIRSQGVHFDQAEKSPLLPIPVLVKNVTGGVMGCPVLRRLEIVSSISRKVPVAHPMSKLMIEKENTGTKKIVTAADPFIYNPFAKNQTKGEILLVMNELVNIDVILANPYAFDLEIHTIVLKTSGVEFIPDPVQTVIPAECKIFPLRLSGTPLESGTLVIHGCTVRILGGFVEEDVLFFSVQKPKPTAKDKNDISPKRAKQSERERVIGKRAL
ncbi:Trafficking protein particle complex subunit 9, partial [Nowakowskiella sp. JEL0078]